MGIGGLLTKTSYWTSKGDYYKYIQIHPDGTVTAGQWVIHPKLTFKEFKQQYCNMKKKAIKLTLEQAQELYEKGNEYMKNLLLTTFTKEELKRSFKSIKTFKDAQQYLINKGICKDLIDDYNEIAAGSYLNKVCKCRIIVAALTDNEKLSLTDGKYYFPDVQFCEVGKEKNCNGNTKIGTIISNGKKYSVIGGGAYTGANAGLGCFYSLSGVGSSYAHNNFLAVSSKEIAEYLSTQFGELIFEVQYGSVNYDWEWFDLYV